MGLVWLVIACPRAHPRFLRQPAARTLIVALLLSLRTGLMLTREALISLIVSLMQPDPKTIVIVCTRDRPHLIGGRVTLVVPADLSVTNKDHGEAHAFDLGVHPGGSKQVFG